MRSGAFYMQVRYRRKGGGGRRGGRRKLGSGRSSVSTDIKHTCIVSLLRRIRNRLFG
jgi:hypothetical protein